MSWKDFTDEANALLERLPPAPGEEAAPARELADLYVRLLAAGHPDDALLAEVKRQRDSARNAELPTKHAKNTKL